MKSKKKVVVVNLNITLSAEAAEVFRRTFNEVVDGPMRRERSDFDQAMLDVYDNVKHATGYRATRFLHHVRTKGGLIVAKHLLAMPTIGRGFAKLLEAGRTDLSVEALVLNPLFSHLFTAEELAIAQGRLPVAAAAE